MQEPHCEYAAEINLLLAEGQIAGARAKAEEYLLDGVNSKQFLRLVGKFVNPPRKSRGRPRKAESLRLDITLHFLDSRLGGTKYASAMKQTTKRFDCTESTVLKTVVLGYAIILKLLGTRSARSRLIEGIAKLVQPEIHNDIAADVERIALSLGHPGHSELKRLLLEYARLMREMAAFQEKKRLALLAQEPDVTQKFLNIFGRAAAEKTKSQIPC